MIREKELGRRGTFGNDSEPFLAEPESVGRKESRPSLSCLPE